MLVLDKILQAYTFYLNRPKNDRWQMAAAYNSKIEKEKKDQSESNSFICSGYILFENRIFE